MWSARLAKGVADKWSITSPGSAGCQACGVYPVSQVKETLEFIAPDLKEGTVVLDTTPIKADVQKWAKEILPEGCYYVGLVPAINPESLHDFEIGLTAARPDLFTKGLFLVDAPPGAPEAAVTVAMDFVHLLGAEAVLADLMESDGLMSTTHLLPQLVSASLLNATIDQPGWLDARKMAGRAYATVTAGLVYQMRSIRCEYPLCRTARALSMLWMRSLPHCAHCVMILKMELKMESRHV
jgi:hypothetical protein